MTKTYEECLDEVVRKYGWPDWKECDNLETRPSVIKDFMREAALLYGESKWNQACEETLDAVYKRIDDEGRINTLAWIKPTFKP